MIIQAYRVTKYSFLCGRLGKTCFSNAIFSANVNVLFWKQSQYKKTCYSNTIVLINHATCYGVVDATQKIFKVGILYGHSIIQGYKDVYYMNY